MKRTMNNYLFLLVFISLLSFSSTDAQTSIKFDSISGNYRIRYQGSEGFVEVTFEPSTKIDPVIEATALFEQGTKLFHFFYTLALKHDSKQYLLSFAVEFNSSLIGFTVPNNTWIADSFLNKRIWNWVNAKKHPRGLWTEKLDIGPGDSLSGFVLKSKGLPAIVNCYLRGNARGLVFPDEPPPDIEGLLEPIESFPRNSIMKYTIGPKDPPESLISLSFLDTLISYKHQARGLGWLKDIRREKSGDDDDDDENQTIFQQLDRRLDKARKELVKGDSVKARQELEKFVRRVEGLRQQSVRAEQRKRQEQVVLTSEAHALLKYNAEYLIDHLPKKRGK